MPIGRRAVNSNETLLGFGRSRARSMNWRDDNPKTRQTMAGAMRAAT